MPRKRAIRAGSDDPIRERNRRAVRIATADPAAVLEGATSIAGVQALSEAGVGPLLLGSLVQYRQASAVSECSGGPISRGHGVPFYLAATRWRSVSGWVRGEHGLQACLPRVQVDGEPDQSVLVRAGDPEWTGAGLPATVAGPDVWRGALAAPLADAARPLADVVIEWLRDTPAGDVSALSVVVEAARLPDPVEAETRQDRRVLPRFAVSDPSPERRAGMLFGGLGQRGDRAQLMLWEGPADKRVPLLELVDESGVPFMAAGRGVPLPARLFVRLLASVRPDDRGLESVRVVLKLGELRDGLFPGGGWRAPRDWPRLRHALRSSRDYGIPTGRGLWFAMGLRYMPDTFDPRGEVVIDVAFPPGSASGPTVELPALDALAVTNAPAWRAYIGALSLAWVPGLTRVKVPGRKWGWSRRLDAYPVLTFEDRRRLAFGSGDRKHRTRGEVDRAFRGLPGVVAMEREVDARTGAVGWRMVPAPAAGEVVDPAAQPGKPGGPGTTQPGKITTQPGKITT